MRRLCRSLVVSLPFFLLAAGLFLLNAQSAFAQATQVDKVGTHLIQGDEGAQRQVLDKLSASGLKSASYPVVVMVDPNGSGTSLLSGSGFLTIARVNVKCDTSISDVVSLASKIPKNVPVVFGNEINNQNKANGEWPCADYSVYASLFTAFAQAWGGDKLGISTMDVTNGDYDAKTILPQIINSLGSSTKYISAVFANVYQTGGCGGYEATRCTVNAGQWILSQINSLTGRNLSTAELYITEFGITTCKDFDCVQDFYVQNNDQPAAAKVGFLRNPTNPDPNNTDWYHTVPAICEYWHMGDLAVEKPEKCGGSKRQAFVYPGIEDMAPDADKMRSMAAGYTLTCGNQFRIKGDISNESAINDYNAHVDPDIDCSTNPPDARCVISGVWANVIIDSTKATIPLYRFQGAQVPNPDQPKRRLDDLEGFFGANYTKDQLANSTGAEQFLPPLANGVSRKLVGQVQQCEATLNYLNTIKSLCDNEGNRSGYTYNDKLDADALKAAALASPTPRPTPTGECALYSHIPGANAQYDTYEKILRGKPRDFSCNAVDTLTVDGQSWYREFSKIELSTPRGFKPAYLVHYIDRPETQQGNNLDKRVVWLAPGEDPQGGIGDPRNLNDRIKVVKVYVPAGFAEVNIDSVNANPDLEAKEKQPTFFPTYTGGFMQTITSIMPLNLQTQIAKTRALVVDKILKAMPGAISGPAIKCDSCASLENNPEYLPRTTIVRRINAGFATSGQDMCTHDDLVAETATERVHTINPPGTLDPVKPAKIPAVANLVANKPGAEPETIKTFLLLPEEYRNIVDYEDPLLQTFLPYDYQDTAKHPEYNFITYESERAANPKAAYKYLEISGITTSIQNPSFPGADISYTVVDPNAPPVIDPVTGQVTPGTISGGGKMSGQLNLEKTLSPDPQVPGGKLARTLWEVVCNVTRPFNNKQTIPYPGFEKFLQQGLKACTQGAVAGSPSQNPTGSGLCSGTTILPPHAQGDWTPLKQLVAQAAQTVGMPANYLWGVLQIEGGRMLTAYGNGQTTAVCSANSVGAVGPMQVLVGACGAPYDNWSTYSPQAGVAGASPCDLLSSLKVAAVMLKFNYNAQAHPNCSPNYPNASTEEKKWMNAAGAYYGSCEILSSSTGCTNSAGVDLTYGECAIEKWAPTY